MKITIDTVEKTISVSGEDTLRNLVTELERLIPLDDWDKYKIKIEKEIVEYPVYTPNLPCTPYPPFPWESPIITYNYNTNDHFIKEPENK